MRDFLDFLARWVEPYVSYRWVIAVIFGAMLVSDLLGTWFWLWRRFILARAQVEVTREEEKLGRIARARRVAPAAPLLVDSLAATARRLHVGRAAAALAIALNAFVFSRRAFARKGAAV
jgi:hypothetical protein